MEEQNKRSKKNISAVISAGFTLLLAVVLLTTSAYAWLVSDRGLVSYAPIAAPINLFIGAGHREFDALNHQFTDDHFEDIRYLYFNGIDVNTEQDHYDYVFCVFGKMVQHYKIQLAFTTNNQFSYSIYHATESTVASEGATAYVTHTDNPQTYYYAPSGEAIAGSFLNDQTVLGETLADSTMHTDTYGAYNNVDKYGEPLYWQTTNNETGYLRGDFINYYILRVWINDKALNDRETDVICIAAKAY